VAQALPKAPVLSEVLVFLRCGVPSQASCRWNYPDKSRIPAGPAIAKATNRTNRPLYGWL